MRALKGANGIGLSCWNVIIAASVVTCPGFASPTSSVTSVRSRPINPIFWLARNGADNALAESEQGEPSAEIAMVTVLLTVVPLVRICTGTQQPSGALDGTWNAI